MFTFIACRRSVFGYTVNTALTPLLGGDLSLLPAEDILRVALLICSWSRLALFADSRGSFIWTAANDRPKLVSLSFTLTTENGGCCDGGD